MSRTRIYHGEMFENGRSIFKGELDVFATDYELSVHEHVEHMFRGKSLNICPFNKKMFWGSAVENGFNITVEGHSLGSYRNGPKGHPGDGEYDIYKVLKLEISGSYDTGGLSVAIEATTGAGSDVCFRAKECEEGKFEAVVINLSFYVPKSELQDFLGFGDNNIDQFLERVESIT